MAVPGSLFCAGALVLAASASLFAAPPAHAQEWLPWRGSSSLQQGLDPAVVLPVTVDGTNPGSSPELVVASTAKHERAGTADAGSPQATLAPVLTDSTVSIEPLPLLPLSDLVPMLVQVAAVVGMPFETVAILGTPVDVAQAGACEDPDRCDRLDALRSGVGVNGAVEDENAKLLPETAARRHMLQSVRTTW